MATLLLSDENETVQRLVAMTFADQGIQVTPVNDGDEAIARISRDRPDIVLASIATPKRSGYDVAAFVKSHPELASTPVLLLASAFEPVDQVRAAQVRCDGVLIKPLEPLLVVTRVKELLPGAAAAPPSPPRVSPSPSGPVPPPETPGTVDDYFDRLDAAFNRRSATRSAAGSDDVGTVPTLDAVLQPPPTAVPVPTPVPSAATPPGPPVVSDVLVDEVTRRVAERLGTGALRDVMADVVADVAERLIREEIARIRSRT